VTFIEDTSTESIYFLIKVILICITLKAEYIYFVRNLFLSFILFPGVLFLIAVIAYASEEPSQTDFHSSLYNAFYITLVTMTGCCLGGILSFDVVRRQTKAVEYNHLELCNE